MKAITLPLLFVALVGAAHAEVVQPEAPKSDVSSKNYEADNSFAGDWKTSFGPMKLEVNGDAVKGTYQMGDELCHIEGKVEGEVMVFNYTEPTAKGQGTFMLAPDGKSFSGKWLQYGEAEWRAWAGARDSEAVSKPWKSSKSYETAIQIGGELVNKVANKVKDMPLNDVKDSAISSAQVAKGLLQTLIAEIPEAKSPGANARLTNSDQAASPAPGTPSPTPSGGSAQGTEPQSAKSLDDLIGRDLVNKDGKKVDISKLGGKIIGIYFSAHWCPPCRQFTPKLVKFRNAHADQFEVVFVSSDRSADDHQKYMKEAGMPWPAIPFGSAQVPLLKGNFKISGIPSLVIVDEKGKLISSQGRVEMATDSANALKKWQSAKDKN